MVANNILFPSRDFRFSFIMAEALQITRIAALNCAWEMAVRAVKENFWVCSQDCGTGWEFKEALQGETYEV